MAEATPPPVQLDAEGRQLEREAAKARFRAEIAKSRKEAAGASEAPGPSFADAGIPSIADAPKGATTIGDGAGSFGSWLIHESLDAAAGALAEAVTGKPDGTTPPALGGGDGVLVVEDRAIRGFDVALAQARATLATATTRLLPLTAQVATAHDRLNIEWANYGVWPPEPPAPDQGGLRRAVGDAVPAEEAEPEPEAKAVAGGGEGPLGAALGLLGLLRTDYTLAATTATTTSAELAILVAASLAAKGVTVQSDSLTTLPATPAAGSLLAELQSVQDTIAALTQKVAELEVALAPMDSAITAIAAAEGTADQAWRDAATSETSSQTAPAELLKQLEEIRRELYPRRATVAHAKAVADAVTQILAEVETGLAGALSATPVPGGEPVLLTALRGEQLRAMTHVLYVHVDDAGGDVVTRQSLLGTSGRLGFLGAASTTWLLIETSTGNIKAGGSARRLRAMGYDIPTAKASTTADPLSDDKLGADPLTALEGWAKGFVLVLIAFLVVVGTALAINVIQGLFD